LHTEYQSGEFLGSWGPGKKWGGLAWGGGSRDGEKGTAGSSAGGLLGAGGSDRMMLREASRFP
jgi:hypothetical protein